MSRARAGRLRRALAGAVLAGGLLVLAAAHWHAAGWHGPFVGGLLATLTAVQALVPLLGFGLALMLRPPGPSAGCQLLFGAGLVAGRIAAARILLPGLPDADWMRMLQLVDPLAFVISGLALLVPWSGPLPVLGAIAGILLGIAIGLEDPSVAGWTFTIGAASAGWWLVGLPGLLWRPPPQPWLRIASRVAGSWLTAIGVLLTAAVISTR